MYGLKLKLLLVIFLSTAVHFSFADQTDINISDAAIIAKITEMDNNNAAISAGSSSGIKENMILYIIRENLYIGKMTIIYVEPEESVGRMYTPEQTPKIGDTVINSLTSAKDEFNLLLEKARNGNAAAQALVASKYENGDGVEKNITTAVQWYKKSAENGNSSAQLSLGLLFYSGQDILQNNDEAFKWFTKAAEQEVGYAQFFLGMMYEKGQGTDKDIAKAVQWLRKSADNDNQFGQVVLGYYYETGYGVTKNISQALIWYQKSADQGNETAKKRVASLNETIDTTSHTIRNKTTEKKSEIPVKIANIPEESSDAHLFPPKDIDELNSFIKENGINPNDKSAALLLACQKGNTIHVRILLSQNADINYTDNNRWMPIHFAVSRGDMDITSLLLENYCDVNPVTSQGHSPLGIASFNNNISLMRLLIEYNASINVSDNNCIPPFIMASMNSSYEAMDFLLKNNADINICNKTLGSALHWAVYCGKLDLVKYLIDKGANIFFDTTMSDNKLHSPLTLARDSNDNTIFKYLKDYSFYKFKLNLTDSIIDQFTTDITTIDNCGKYILITLIDETEKELKAKSQVKGIVASKSAPFKVSFENNSAGKQTFNNLVNGEQVVFDANIYCSYKLSTVVSDDEQAAMDINSKNNIWTAVTPSFEMSEGSILFYGSVKLNNNKIEFIKGSVHTESIPAKPIFSDGTICKINGNKYEYFSNTGWIPTNL